jgi:hypothetical protein
MECKLLSLVKQLFPFASRSAFCVEELIGTIAQLARKAQNMKTSSGHLVSHVWNIFSKKRKPQTTQNGGKCNGWRRLAGIGEAMRSEMGAKEGVRRSVRVRGETK